MSQLIACQTHSGIVLAADGQATDFEPSGEMIQLKVERLVQLSPHTAIAAGGAADGVHMCHALRRFIAAEKLDDVEEVYRAALPFLGSEFDQFMRKRCETLPVDPVHHVFFVLGGYTGRDATQPFRLYLIWTKKKLPLLDGDEITRAFTVPRVMRMEHKLNRLSQENAGLDQVLSQIKRDMEEIARSQEEVGPPFSYGLITQEGVRPA